MFDNADLKKAVVVFASDRRISLVGKPYDTRKKIFRVPGLPAGIGYFGLAEVPAGTGKRPMSEWLVEFLRSRRSADSLADFASELAAALNSAVPEAWRRRDISGFHLGGFDKREGTVFWYVRNVEDDGRTLFGEYRPREDFKARDAPRLKPGEHMIYRNGDVRAHVVAWSAIDESLGRLLDLSEFRPLGTVDDYVGWVRFKMQAIARFYAKYCTISIIGAPIDAFAIEGKELKS